MILSHEPLDNVGHILPSTGNDRMCPSISIPDVTWEASYMIETPLQRFVRLAVANAPEARDYYDKLIQKRTGTTGKAIFDIERGKSKNPSSKTLGLIADALCQPIELLTLAANGREVDPVDWYEKEPDLPPEVQGRGADLDVLHRLNLVQVPDASHNYAMGAGAFVDVGSVEYRYFDRSWLRSVTQAPVGGLVFVRGVGDSMLPTIHEDDGILVNTGEFVLDRQDKIWAFTYGGLGMIKRIRSIPSRDDGPRYLIISDNTAVENFEVLAEEIAIKGRVVWISRRV